MRVQVRNVRQASKINVTVEMKRKENGFSVCIRLKRAVLSVKNGFYGRGTSVEFDIQERGRLLH